MKIPEYILASGLTEQDVWQTLSNTYTPGFMQMHLRVHFTGSFKDMLSKEDQGIFFHEYVHYLQNLSTPWGLYTSMMCYLEMVDTYKFIQESTNPILLPLSVDLGEEANRKKEIIRTGNGQNPLNSVFGSLVIDRNQIIVWHRKLKDIGGKQYPYIILDIPCMDNVKSVRFGAYMIKESMAAMCQMLYDPSATHKEHDLPYNLVKVLAEQSFPNIADDNKKLISICYLSLFSLSPAEVLFDQLDYANNNPHISGTELLEKFVSESKITLNGKNGVSVVDFFEDIANRFEKILSSSLGLELDYIHEAISRVRLSKGTYPIISAIYDESFGEDVIQGLIDHVGIPYIYTDYDEYHYPESVKEPGEASSDMVNLLGQHAIYHYMVRPNLYRCCPLYYMCKKSTFNKEECFDAPWKGHQCVMTVMGNHIGLDKKDIHW